MTEETAQADEIPAEIIEDHAEQEPAKIINAGHTVTYSPEDNKLRLYVGRVPRDEYLALRKAGWTSTPKQSCDFVATWTPEREDQAREYLEEGEDIGDEDYSPEERAADRAERFTGYLDKRREEAGAAADQHAAGPAAFGHQNRSRAERQARRHDRHRSYALTQWSKAEYWQWRTAGVISHALHKTDARTRRGRILTLEAEQRKIEKSHAEYVERFKKWQIVPTLDGANKDIGTKSPAATAAYILSQAGWEWSSKYKHPRTGEEGDIYDLMRKGGDPITPAEAAALWLERRGDPETDETSNSYRWRKHYELRLTYEKAMLANEGGMAGDADIIPGGFIRGQQITRVFKSPATGRVTSVSVWGTFKRYDRKKCEYTTEPGEVRINVERLGEGAYRPPTEPELKEFNAAQKTRKADAKAKKPPEPKTINPTDADAERLQKQWNDRGEAKHKQKGQYGDYTPSEIVRMTQEQYSARSKGTYSSCNIGSISEKGRLRETNDNSRKTVFKIRNTSGSGGSWYQAPRVIILTDKPRQPIPWGEIEAAAATMPTRESLRPKIEEIARIGALAWWPEKDDEACKLFEDAIYVGWAFRASMTQFGWTTAGHEAWREWMNEKEKTQDQEPPAPIITTAKPAAAGSLFDEVEAAA